MLASTNGGGVDCDKVSVSYETEEELVTQNRQCRKSVDSVMTNDELPRTRKVQAPIGVVGELRSRVAKARGHTRPILKG